MRERVNNGNFYVKSREDTPFVCHLCGQITTVSIVDTETRMNLPYCERCGVVPTEGWKAWETRAKRANKALKASNIESLDLFDDELLSLKLEGFYWKHFNNNSKSHYRKYLRPMLRLPDNIWEELYLCYPTADQLIDLNELLLSFWEQDLSKRPESYEVLFAALLYEFRIIDFLTNDLQERILGLIETLPEDIFQEIRTKLSHEKRAEGLGYSTKDRNLKTYWKTYTWINRHLVSLLTKCGMASKAKQLDGIGKYFDVYL